LGITTFTNNDQVVRFDSGDSLFNFS
jgi:hypothetical protein